MQQQLSDSELETYARQIALADIDYDGQLKLRNARACVIGLGGLGSMIAPKLAAMGIGYLRLVDRDIVSRSDLHRQYLYDADSVGVPKVEAALRRLNRLNPDVELEAVPESLNSRTVESLVGGVDVVLDGLDRPEPRYLLNRACQRLQVPYVFGAAIEASGNLSTFVPGKTICLECFMPGLKDEDLPKCGVVGVHPSVLGIVTALQVAEAIRLITGKEPKLLNKLFYIDLRELRFDSLEIQKLEECPVCGSTPQGKPVPVEDKLIEETCARDGRRNFVLSPAQPAEINLQKLDAIVAGRGFSIKKSGLFGITFEPSPNMTVSLLKSATMIVQTPPAADDDLRDRIIEMYRSILVDGLGLPAGIVPSDA